MQFIHTAFALGLSPGVEVNSLASWCALATQALMPTSGQVALARQAPPHSAADAVRRGAKIAQVQGSAAVHLLRSSQDPVDFVARWNLLNEAVPSKHVTRLQWDGASALRLHHGHRSDAPAAQSQLYATAALCAGLGSLGLRLVCKGLVFDGAQVLGQPDSDLRPGTWVIELLGETKRAAVPNPVSQPVVPPVLATLWQALELEPGRPWTLEQAAQTAELSPRALQRVMAAQGVTWPQWVRAVRLHAASHRILDGSMALTQVAHELGFSDSAHFSRGFRTAAGMAPSVYRAVAHGRNRWRAV